MDPSHLVAAAVITAGVLKVLGPLTDVDLPWHIRLGGEIRAGAGPTTAGQDWSFSVSNPDWATTMWLSEVGMSLLYDLAGWQGFVVARVVLLLLTAAALAGLLLLRFPARAAVPPFTVALVAVAVHMQERPQALSWLFVVLVAAWICRILVDASPPSWWWVLLATALWANLHGMWVLAPAALALAGVARWANERRLDRAGWSSLALAALAAASGMLTPLGPAGLLAPLSVGDAATAVIIEWQRTDLISWNGMALVAMVFMVAGALIAAASRDLGWWIYLAAVVAFGLVAARNATPAVLLLAPAAAHLLTRALGPNSASHVSPRESRALLAFCGITVVAGSLTALGAAALTEPDPDEIAPFTLARVLQEEPGAVKVLNDYEAAGAVLFEASQAQVAVDGRTDYYGADYLTRYVRVLATGEGAEDLLDELDPTHALLESRSPVADLLRSRGWQVLNSDEEHVLLAP